MRSHLIGVAAALMAASNARAGFDDFYLPGGATEVARWEFNDGQFTDFINQGVVVDDVVGGNSSIYNGYDQPTPHNVPSGGVYAATDGRYFAPYPNSQGDGGELQAAFAGPDSSFSFYMRYKFEAATERFFYLMSKGYPEAYLYHNGNGGGLALGVTAASNGEINIVTSDITAASFADGYHDVVATYDATTGLIGIYLDGVNRGLVFNHGNGTGVQQTPLNFDLFTASYLPGGAVDAPGVPAAYNLMVDEVRVYDGMVSVIAAPPTGDVNDDGFVDIFDVNVVSANWGSPGGPTGDANRDGNVDIFDVNLISANWNPPGGAAVVPEPGTLVLSGWFALAAAAFLRRARRKA